MRLETLYDNQIVPETIAQHSIVTSLLNRDLASLDKENFIIFPQQVSQSADLDSDKLIFQSRNGKTWTGNIVGVLSDGEDELAIHSRFTNQLTKDDFFLRYMLQRVLHYNVTENKLASSSQQSYYDLLVFLFPYYLNKAVGKGLYKEYVKQQYNDTNVKGAIDISQQIRSNIPFVGKVAYRTREFRYDNPLTQLVRHTIEKIQKEYPFLLQENKKSRENVRLLRQEAASYSPLKRLDVLQENLLNPVRHSYFEAYSSLQRICIQILSEEKAGFGNDDQQVHGIVIDVAWLWEEYIDKVTGWKHYGRKRDLATMHLFKQPKSSPRYPDFVDKGIPIDTKYKRKIDTRNDYNQLTTYLHILSEIPAEKRRGGFLQPTDDWHSKAQGYEKIGTLSGLGGELFTYRFYIPQTAESYELFVEEIHKIEKRLKETFN